MLADKGTDGISVFDAVEKQSGLNSDLQNAPLTSLLIESVNRRPDDNPSGVATALSVTPVRFETASIKLANQTRNVGLVYTGDNQMRADGTICVLIVMAFQIPPNVAGDMPGGLPKRRRP